MSYQATTYDNTEPQMRVIADQVDIIGASDIPGIKYFGGLSGSPEAFRILNFPGKKLEWLS